MFKKFLSILAVVAFLLTLTGCGQTAPAAPQAQNNKGAGANRGNGFEQMVSSSPLFANRQPGTVLDLAVGKRIMAFGTANPDTTINAQQIILGAFPNFGFNRPHPTSTTSTIDFSQRSSSPQGGNWNGGQGGQGQGSTTVSGRSGGNRQRAAASGRASGEIMKLDSSSIVLKTENGGSRIIFYSDKTQIFILPVTSTISSTTQK